MGQDLGQFIEAAAAVSTQTLRNPKQTIMNNVVTLVWESVGWFTKRATIDVGRRQKNCQIKLSGRVSRVSQNGFR